MAGVCVSHYCALLVADRIDSVGAAETVTDDVTRGAALQAWLGGLLPPPSSERGDQSLCLFASDVGLFAKKL